MGRVIWITGLSGAGKSALAVALVRKLRRYSDKTVLLDGDELRVIFNTHAFTSQNYDKNQRINMGKKYALLSKMLANQGFVVVVATISMFDEVYSWNRENLPGYYEIFLKVPLEELRRRDTKGIYSHFDAGSIRNVAGLDLDIDEPTNSDWVEQFASNKGSSMLAEELMGALGMTWLGKE